MTSYLLEIMLLRPRTQVVIRDEDVVTEELVFVVVSPAQLALDDYCCFTGKRHSANSVQCSSMPSVNVCLIGFEIPILFC